MEKIFTGNPTPDKWQGQQHYGLPWPKNVLCEGQTCCGYLLVHCMLATEMDPFRQAITVFFLSLSEHTLSMFFVSIILLFKGKCSYVFFFCSLTRDHKFIQIHISITFVSIDEPKQGPLSQPQLLERIYLRLSALMFASAIFNAITARRKTSVIPMYLLNKRCWNLMQLPAGSNQCQE